MGVKEVRRFIDHINDEQTFDTKYSAGIVRLDGNRYTIAYEQNGAAETFSIGQPVYDRERNLMGYLCVGLYDLLDYSADIRIPVERWEICLPTKDCKDGKKVYTYWQNKECEVDA